MMEDRAWLRRYRIAVIPGDGIGPEVVDVSVRALDEVARADGDFTFDFEDRSQPAVIVATAGVADAHTTEPVIFEVDASV